MEPRCRFGLAPRGFAAGTVWPTPPAPGMLDEDSAARRERASLSKCKTQTQWSPDATPNDLVGVHEDDCARDSRPRTGTRPRRGARSGASQPDADSPARRPPRSAAATSPWHDLPVASVLPPLAPLVPSPSPSPLEDRLHRLEAELARCTPRAATAPSPPDPAASVVRQPAASGAASARACWPLPAPPQRRRRRRWTAWRRWSRPACAAAGSSSTPSASCGRCIACFSTRVIAYRGSAGWRRWPSLVLIVTSSSLDVRARVCRGRWGMIIDKAADLILAYFLFKLLSHEARRYRETAPDLPPSLRL